MKVPKNNRDTLYITPVIDNVNDPTGYPIIKDEDVDKRWIELNKDLKKTKKKTKKKKKRVG